MTITELEEHMTAQEAIAYMCRNNMSFYRTYVLMRVSADIAMFTEVCNDYPNEKWDLVWHAIHELKYRGKQISEFTLYG